MKKIFYLSLLLILPLNLFGQFSKSLKEMKYDSNLSYEKYESLIFKATSYIFSNPFNPKSEEFYSAAQIVSFWMNKDTGVGIPVYGDFYKSLTNKNQQQFLYTTAMIHYGLDQKINHNRILKCVPIKGQKYSMQEDVREVQLEGAKVILEYMGNKKNNVPMSRKTKKYFKAYKKNLLKEKFFE
ncbi:MAG: hypothetical protein JXR05_04740 [Flavobacteriaceae bacterium]